MQHAGPEASTLWSTNEPRLGQDPPAPLPADWDRLKAVIHALYIEKKLRLKDVQLIMERDYSFKAT